MKHSIILYIVLTMVFVLCSCTNSNVNKIERSDTPGANVMDTIGDESVLDDPDVKNTNDSSVPVDEKTVLDNSVTNSTNDSIVPVDEIKLKKCESAKTGLKYLLSLPQGYNSDSRKSWPLILMLHGSGDRGDDLELVKRSGFTSIAEKDGLKFIAVYPQCPLDNEWEEMTETLSVFLDELTDSLRVDKDRISLSGFSMGGYGTWYMALKYPDRFAAIAPVCGSIFEQDLNEETAERLKNIPIWAFHGALDDIVPIDDEKELIDLIKKAGGNVKYKIYEGWGHDVWTPTYKNSEIFDWLLLQKRQSTE